MRIEEGVGKGRELSLCLRFFLSFFISFLMPLFFYFFGSPFIHSVHSQILTSMNIR
jgi:hypothetical protein